MRIYVAQSCIRSVSALDERARAAVKSAIFDFLVSPSAPGFRLHRVDSREAYWSLRVNGDIRIIAARVPAGMVLCHADRHDRAYAWAQRHAFEPRYAAVAGEVDVLEIVQRAEEPLGDPHRASAAKHDPPGVDPLPAPKPSGAAESPSAGTRRLRLRMRAESPFAPARGPAASARGGPAPIADLMRLFRRVRGLGPGSATEAAPGACADPTTSARAPQVERVGSAIVAFAAVACAAPLGVGLACASILGAGPVALGAAALGALVVAAAAAAIYVLARRALAGATAEAERVIAAVREGQLDVRADPATVLPVLRPHVVRFGELTDAVAGPLRLLTEALERVARGELPPPLTQRLGRDFDPAREAVNAIIDFMRMRGEDVRLALDAAPGSSSTPGEITR